MDTRTSGRVWYADPITQDIDLLERAKTDIHGAFSEHWNFTPTYLLISTWDHVGYFKENDDKVYSSSWGYIVVDSNVIIECS